MGNYTIAVATNGNDGLDDTVSGVFGRAKTFTIIGTEDKNVINVTIFENSARSYDHGAGPIAVKLLVDERVEVLLSNKLGIGAAELLKQHNIKHMLVKPNVRVEDVLREAIGVFNC